MAIVKDPKTPHMDAKDQKPGDKRTEISSSYPNTSPDTKGDAYPTETSAMPSEGSQYTGAEHLNNNAGVKAPRPAQDARPGTNPNRATRLNPAYKHNPAPEVQKASGSLVELYGCSRLVHGGVLYTSDVAYDCDNEQVGELLNLVIDGKRMFRRYVAPVPKPAFVPAPVQKAGKAIRRQTTSQSQMPHAALPGEVGAEPGDVEFYATSNPADPAVKHLASHGSDAADGYSQDLTSNDVRPSNKGEIVPL